MLENVLSVDIDEFSDSMFSIRFVTKIRKHNGLSLKNNNILLQEFLLIL